MFKAIFLILIVIFLLLGLFFGWIAISIPFKASVAHIGYATVEHPPVNDTLTLLTWNIGYAGLGQEMDFFFDGGKRVRASRENSEANLESIKAFLRMNEDVDVFLLQEVDKRSARTYNQDQTQILADHLPEYSSSFSWNYKVAFVPAPLTQPLGRVSSGLLTISRMQPVEVTRIALPGRFPWPKQWFMPYRCLMMSRFPVNNNHDLVIINIHNTAFDEGGKQRALQTAFIRDLIQKEFQQGHFVVVGGDWNQCPEGFNHTSFSNGDVAYLETPVLAENFFKGWTLAWDPEIPTNRALNVPFVRGQTKTTLIDYFLYSPNIALIEVNTIDLAFRHTDHHPVKIKLQLKNQENPVR